MAAKNLREAILTPLMERGIYLDHGSVMRLESEIRDFFAHEVMRGYTPAGGEETATQLFDRVFKTIPAVRSDK